MNPRSRRLDPHPVDTYSPDDGRRLLGLSYRHEGGGTSVMLERVHPPLGVLIKTYGQLASP